MERHILGNMSIYFPGCSAINITYFLENLILLCSPTKIRRMSLCQTLCKYSFLNYKCTMVDLGRLEGGWGDANEPNFRGLVMYLCCTSAFNNAQQQWHVGTTTHQTVLHSRISSLHIAGLLTRSRAAPREAFFQFQLTYLPCTCT